MEDNKPRRVPRKLPLQSVEQSRPWPGEHRSNGSTHVRNKTLQMPVNNKAQDYCEIMDGSSSMQVTQNGFHWEMECTSSNSMEKTIAMDRTAIWTGQWHPPPDDVQPCSSKTIDPYSFA